MKKMLRKITALVLVLILTGLCCVNAYDLPLSEYFDNGRYKVTITGDISQYATSGTLMVERVGNSTQVVTDVYRSVSVTYRYIVVEGNTPVVKIGTKTDTPNTQIYAFAASVSYSNTSMYQMVNATYTYEADIPCSYGTQHFRPESKTITYEP